MASSITDKVRVKTVGREARREARKARDVLTDHWPVPDEAVHDARKRLKRARAALRLMRDAIGERAFDRHNAALRDAARPLSRLRDAQVLLESFDRLMKNAWDEAPRALGAVHSMLVEDHVRLRNQILPESNALQTVLEPLDAGTLNGKTRGGRAGWNEIEKGLRRVYKAGRKALAAVRENPTLTNLHEWRKQAKYLWNTLQIVEPIRPRRIASLARAAHRLSDQLGEDHDLAVLALRLKRASSRVSKATLDLVTEHVDERRKRLQAQALKLGEKIYARPPKRFVARLAG